MTKFFGMNGWGRKRFILLLIVQLVVVGMVVSFIQRLPTDLNSIVPVRHIKKYNVKRPFGDEARSLFGQEIIKIEDEQSSRLFSLIPYHNELSRNLQARNAEKPRNKDLFPKLPRAAVTIVLYVHNRPQYLKIVVDSLSKVKGINETLLIVSHDGFFPEMNAIIEEIRFCQVKQIFATFSPHLFPNSFPGEAPEDCKLKQDAQKLGCKGNPDRFGTHREAKIVSLKHHWWWMMNTVWDGLAETRRSNGYVLFIEEDHYILPNAYRSIQMLSKMASKKCPECVALNLAPVEVLSRGEGVEALFVEKIGNVGYAFNRTVWKWMKGMAEPFCSFDEYNWDITMWSVVYPSFPTGTYTLRGPRTSAIHFGKCGLHQGQDKGPCIDDISKMPYTHDEDSEPFLNENWRVIKLPIIGYTRGFEGWGGWGDKRDRELCMNFTKMYGGW